MKTLLIMRHANSTWDNPELSDFERPLNSWGLKAAPLMGNILYQNNLRPNLIISSPAKRAKQTAVLVKEVAEVKQQIQYLEQIYKARPTVLLSLVSKIEDKYESVLLIGHNPGIEDFIKILTNQFQPMSTSSIAQISLKLEKWSEITANCGRLELVWHPNDLMEGVLI